MTARFGALLTAVLAAGCQDATEPPGRTSPELDAHLIVSNPVGAAAQLAYVSLAPGTVPSGAAGAITNLRTGATRSAPLIAGGLDPLAIEAVVGDTVSAAIDVGEQRPVVMLQVVPAQQALVVVRTDPSAGTVDVPLDARVTIVFSEPLDGSSVTAETAGLEQNGARVTGAIEVSSDALRAAIAPAADLLPGTRYTIVLGSGLRGLDGAGLDSPPTVVFRTRAALGADSFPTAPANAQVYERTTPEHIQGGGRSRYVLHPDGRFGLQYVSNTWGFFEYTGRHLRQGAGIRLDFDANAGQWWATGTVAGDSLVVEYNLDMQLSDFENGAYRLALPPQASEDLAFSRGGDLYLINADGSGLRQLTSGPTEDTEAAWSPDGRRIAFTRYDHNRAWWGSAGIYLINADGTGLVRLSLDADSIYDAHPTWSADGTRLAFSSRRDVNPGSVPTRTEIWTMRMDGTDLVRLTFLNSITVEPAWSPDGSRIAYVAPNPEAGDGSIYVMQADGTNPRAVLTGGDLRAPAWSPDGRRILTRRVKCLGLIDPDPSPEIGPECGEWEGPYLIAARADGSGAVKLSDYLLNSDWEHSTLWAWSPDGLQIAFTQTGCPWPQGLWGCALPSHVELLRLADGQVTELTEGAAPSWRR